MSEQSDKAGQVLVLLGGGGDLALRMLLPSLYNLDADRLLPPDMRIVGVARHPLHDDGGYLKLAREALDKRTKVDEQVWTRFSARLSYWALAVGSAWLVLSVSQGYQPPPPVALLCAAAALHAARTSGRGGARWI